MNGTQEAPTGAPLAAHFEAKRRIMATVKQMEGRGEKLEEATPEEILEAAYKAEETVFKFEFSLATDGKEDVTKKRSRNRKRNKKRRSKKSQDDAQKSENITQQGNAKDVSGPAQKQKPPSFFKLRKATGTESEVAKMQLRYGQGRRNLTAIKQREHRKKTEQGVAVSDEFKFNFAASS